MDIPPPPHDDDLIPPPPPPDDEQGSNGTFAGSRTLSVIITEDEETGSIGLVVNDVNIVTGYTQGGSAGRDAGIPIGCKISAANGIAVSNKEALVDVLMDRDDDDLDVELEIILPDGVDPTPGTLCADAMKASGVPFANAGKSGIAPGKITERDAGPIERAKPSRGDVQSATLPPGHEKQSAKTDRSAKDSIKMEPQGTPSAAPPTTSLHIDRIFAGSSYQGNAKPEPDPEQLPQHVPGTAGIRAAQHAELEPTSSPQHKDRDTHTRVVSHPEPEVDQYEEVSQLKWRSGAKWTGETVDGRYEGFGRYDYAEGSRYRGAYEAGQRHGQGLCVFANGDRYDGDWSYGLRHGRGRYTWANGDEYTGEWVEGLEEGEGCKSWANGDRYEGGWQMGKRHGEYGLFSWGGGMHQYQGPWENDMPHGMVGRVVLGDGSRYEGGWHRGQRHGQGREQLPDGTVYTGGWANDMRQGHGELYGNEDSYVGQWHRGQRHGAGQAILQRGKSSEKTYSGEWHLDHFHGHGLLVCKDGRKYDGEWQCGRRHGQGKFWFKDGSWYEGEWKNHHRHGHGKLHLASFVEYDGDWVESTYTQGVTWQHAANFGAVGQGGRTKVGELLGDGQWTGHGPHIPTSFRRPRAIEDANMQPSAPWRREQITSPYEQLPHTSPQRQPGMSGSVAAMPWSGPNHPLTTG